METNNIEELKLEGGRPLSLDAMRGQDITVPVLI